MLAFLTIVALLIGAAMLFGAAGRFDEYLPARAPQDGPVPIPLGHHLLALFAWVPLGLVHWLWYPDREYWDFVFWPPFWIAVILALISMFTRHDFIGWVIMIGAWLVLVLLLMIIWEANHSDENAWGYRETQDHKTCSQLDAEHDALWSADTTNRNTQERMKSGDQEVKMDAERRAINHNIKLSNLNYYLDHRHERGLPDCRPDITVIAKANCIGGRNVLLEARSEYADQLDNPWWEVDDQSLKTVVEGTELPNLKVVTNLMRFVFPYTTLGRKHPQFHAEDSYGRPYDILQFVVVPCDAGAGQTTPGRLSGLGNARLSPAARD